MSSSPAGLELGRHLVFRSRFVAAVFGLTSCLFGATAKAGDASLAPVVVDPSYHLFGGLALGEGLRFNNPYRLRTELGKDAQSLSLTAAYADAFVAATIGGAGAFSHGLAVHASFALGGITQEVLTPAYVLLVRPTPRLGFLGHVGIPIVIEPDLNAGFEAAAGGIFYVTASFGLTASLVGSLFYGAATLDSSRSTIAILSIEGGLVYDYEVLP
jgi:hypothetical protein